MRGKRSEAAGFLDMIDGWVLRVVEGGTRGFGPLICALPGVYPGVVREALRRLARRRMVPTSAVQEMLAPGPKEWPPRRAAFIRSVLPVPHPLDYDWRYAEAAHERLLDEYAALAKPQGPLALLGAPSVVPAALRREPRPDVVAIDNNSLLVTALRRAYPQAQVILADLVRGKLLELPKAAVVIADPPWYPEHLHAFLWAGTRMCRRHGHVLTSLPPLGTRPGMAEERARFMAFAEELGLRLVRLEEGALPYVSPPFEQNALRAYNMSGVPLDWRRGDMAHFTQVGETLPARPAPPPREERWHEVTISGVCLRLCPKRMAGFVDPCLASLVAGDILPSVSRRDTRRQSADVWTTGNRIFACAGSGILLQILEALRAGRLPVQRVARFLGRDLDHAEAGLVRRASEQASDLIGVEQDEQSTWEEHCRDAGPSLVAV